MVRPCWPESGVKTAAYNMAWFVHLNGQQILNSAIDSVILDDTELK